MSKLKKVILGPDWIDLSFGEPKVIAAASFRQLNRAGSKFQMPNMYELPKWGYQLAEGNKELSTFLEGKYKAKVLVCNGAKQALAAVMYGYKNSTDCSGIYFSKPHYPSIPSIIDMIGLQEDPTPNGLILATSPNNPDGSIISNEEIRNMMVSDNVIHDAAYYTPIYLPDGHKVEQLGDVQIFSFSKTYGLSGLRIGYAVFYDDTTYEKAVEYVETCTAGTSIASQVVALNIEKYFAENPDHLSNFHKEAKEAITASREELLNLDADVLKVEACQSNSMFAWCTPGPALDYKTAKVNILDGSIFGQPGMVRLNIAHPVDVIREAVQRLNQHKIRS